MNIKRKYVIMGLVLLGIAWAGNIYYYKMHVLKGPLFVKHYYDIKNGMDVFRLHFFENINDKNGIAYVSFPEMEDGYLSADIFNGNNDGRYYSMKTIQIRIPRSSDGIVPDSLRNRVITKIRAYTMDGRTYDEDIGRIYLNWDVQWDHNLEFATSRGSSNYTGYTMFSSKTDMKIYGVDSKFPEMLDKPFYISLNKTPLKDVKFPIVLKKGSTITVDYGFMFNEEDIRKNDAYEYTVDLLIEDESGNRGVCPVYLDYWRQSPEEYDIAAMRRNRGEY